MRAAAPFLALLLSGLGLVAISATTEATLGTEGDGAGPGGVKPHEAVEHPSRLHPHGKMPGRGPVVSGPMTGGKQDVTGSNDEHLNDVSKVSSLVLPSYRAVYIPRLYLSFTRTLQWGGGRLPVSRARFRSRFLAFSRDESLT